LKYINDGEAPSVGGQASMRFIFMLYMEVFVVFTALRYKSSNQMLIFVKGFMALCVCLELGHLPMLFVSGSGMVSGDLTRRFDIAPASGASRISRRESVTSHPPLEHLVSAAP